MNRKYNETYFDGLYRFEDVPKVLIIGIAKLEKDIQNGESQNLKVEDTSK